MSGAQLGHIYSCMQTEKTTAEHTISLLASQDIVKVCAEVAGIVQAVSKLPFVAIVLWDPDLEMLSDRLVFGPASKKVESFIGTFSDEFEAEAEDFIALQSEDFSIGYPDEIAPLFCWQVRNEDTLCACVLFQLEDEADEKSAFEELKAFPVGLAIARAWEFRELQKENERLRNSYEELEDKTSLLEEQTRKLIHDLTARDSIRTRHVERERLVYSISNVVRSYVDIQKVLETTVERIGATFGVNRCLLLRPLDNLDELSVYEYIKSADSVKPNFLSDEGRKFTQVALAKATPHDLIESDFDNQDSYNPTFLRTLAIKSGLLVPLVMRERVLGVLFLQDCSVARAWSIDDISLIGSLADQVSVAIENAELHLEKERQAVTDGLTGIANRRSFNDNYSKEFERASRYNQPLSLVLVDLDFLKVINDTFGHQIGDEAIKTIGHLLKQSSRSVDLPARYGGEEFCLLLPNTEINMAEQLAERIRRLINDVHIEGPGHISASLGVANFPIHADEPEELFKRADEALYEAKQSGRNMVKTAPLKNASASLLLLYIEERTSKTVATCFVGAVW